MGVSAKLAPEFDVITGKILKEISLNVMPFNDISRFA